MKFKAKYYLVFSHDSVKNIKWECTTHYECIAHIPQMLQELLNVKTIKGEWKLIWNDEHRRDTLKEYNVTNEELNNYLQADSEMIAFSAVGTRKRAIKEMKRLGVKEMRLVDNYRDVILCQAYYNVNKKFPNLNNPLNKM